MTRIEFSLEQPLEEVAEADRLVGRGLCNGAIATGNLVELQCFAQAGDPIVL